MKILTLALTLAASTLVFGQQTSPSCSGGVSPTIRGFRLGIKTQDVTSKYKGLRLGPVDAQGQQTVALTVSPNSLEGQNGLINLEQSSIISKVRYPELTDINRMELAFIDGSLYSVSVRYENVARWKDVDQFVSTISPSLQLPQAGWVEDEERDYVRHLACSQFEVHAKVEGGRASLQLLDPAAPLTIAARKVEHEEKRRRAFKP